MTPRHTVSFKSHAETWARERVPRSSMDPLTSRPIMRIAFGRMVFLMSLRFRASATILSTTNPA